MQSQRNRLILDTNLWISFLITKDFSKLDKVLTDGNVVLLFSQELLDEFIAVTQRPKFKKYFSKSDTTELLLSLRNKIEFTDTFSVVDHCRDPKDNFLLALAIDGKATHLLTGDNDLLDLKTTGKTKIMTIHDYLISS